MKSIQDSVFKLPIKIQRQFLSNVVDSSIKSLFPSKYLGLCHVYAILGSNLLSVIYNKNYRPVAGVGIIEDGRGRRLEMLDNAAFSRHEGGAYHCWIESVGDEDPELIDFIYKHNAAYARVHGQGWHDPSNRGFLWGIKNDLCIRAELNSLPKDFPQGKVWFNETQEGAVWLLGQINSHRQEYSKLTAHTLKRLALDLKRVK